MSDDDPELPDSATRTARTADSLMRDGEDSFTEKYSRHDVGELYVHAMMNELGLHVDAWGIDMRDDDGTLIQDSRMDFKVYYDEDLTDLAALIDVKTKGRPHWMGKFNLRHFHDYEVHRTSYGVPTFVIFCLLNDDENGVKKTQVVPVERNTIVDNGTRFPDGNRMAEAKEVTDDYGWEVFQARVGV